MIRFLNHERFNWRKFIYFLALRIIALSDSAQYSEKTLIVDDTVSPKTGKDIELISYHFDHKAKRSMLGNQCLQLGYHKTASVSSLLIWPFILQKIVLIHA
ncbi:MAG: transposase [bacterium]